MNLLLAISLSVAGLLLLGMLAVLRHVPDHHAWIVNRRGQFSRVLRPGWRVLWPLLDRVVQRVPLIGHRVDLPLRSQVDPHVTGERATVYYQILEPERSGARLADIDQLVEQTARIQANVLAAVNRDSALIADRLRPLLNLELGSLGLRVTRCQLPGS